MAGFSSGRTAPRDNFGSRCPGAGLRHGPRSQHLLDRQGPGRAPGATPRRPRPRLRRHGASSLDLRRARMTSPLQETETMAGRSTWCCAPAARGTAATAGESVRNATWSTAVLPPKRTADWSATGPRTDPTRWRADRRAGAAAPRPPAGPPRCGLHPPDGTGRRAADGDRQPRPPRCPAPGRPRGTERRRGPGAEGPPIRIIRMGVADMPEAAAGEPGPGCITIVIHDHLNPEMIRNRYNLKQVEALVCVVDMGSFRRAAAVLGTTQPNVSARIAALEETLGLRLLHRDQAGVRPTERGAALLPAARQVLWAAEALLETAGRTDLIDERLRLGVTELIACTWLHPFLRAFREVYPAVSVELRVDLAAEIDAARTAGEIDLALMNAAGAEAGPGTVPLGSSPYGWTAAPEVAAGIAGAGLAALLRGPVIAHARRSAAARDLARAAARAGLSTAGVVHCSSLAAARQMAVDGMGAALLPTALTRAAEAAGQLVAVPCTWLPGPLDFVAAFDVGRAARHVRAAADCAASLSRGDHGF
ncbi:LysR family transcriptional regulator [Rhodobacteraceae bacterium CCMM004]|nr:LysR family transcriptional regulator [Rhodobacteraceae bacterium CCMM004]